MTCLFCESSSLRLVFTGTFHPYAEWHGPFDFYLCNKCGSGQTFPLPGTDSLSRLYTAFEGGMIPEIRKLRDDYPLHRWFRQNIERAIQKHVPVLQPSDNFTFLDIGAGNGELVKEIAATYKNAHGMAVDFHPIPEPLKDMGNLVWKKTDLNLEGLPSFSADLIFLVTVFEHLLYPDKLIREALSRLNKNGCFYLTTPRIDCLVFRLLKKNWPYFLPGEHLYIPSIRGMETLLERICRSVFPSTRFSIDVGPVTIPYPAPYYAKYVGLKKLGGLIPRSWLLRLPTGLLEASVSLGS